MYITQELLDQIENVALGKPPTGVTADYAHREFHGEHVLVAVYVFAPLMFFAGFMRIYARAVVIRRWTIEDYFFCLAWVGSLSWLIVVGVVMKQGVVGYHEWDVHMKDMTLPFLKSLRAMQELNDPVKWLVKSTLLCIIMTAFYPIRSLRYTCIAGIVTVGCFYGSDAIVYWIACRPIGGNDRVAYLNGNLSSSCSDFPGLARSYELTTGVFNIISDFVILLLPLPAISKLHMPKGRKLGLYAVFSSGAVACIMSILGLVFRLPHYQGADGTYKQMPLLTTSIIELAIGIMIPCATVIYRFVQHVYPPLRSLVTSSNARSQGTKLTSRRKTTATTAHKSISETELTGVGNTRNFDGQPGCEDVELGITTNLGAEKNGGVIKQQTSRSSLGSEEPIVRLSI